MQSRVCPLCFFFPSFPANWREYAQYFMQYVIFYKIIRKVLHTFYNSLTIKIESGTTRFYILKGGQGYGITCTGKAAAL